MCKVASVTKVTDKNRDEVWTFMQILGEYMSYGNNHGLGYAAFDRNFKLFGERWLINKHAFLDMSYVKGLTAAKMNNLYSYFGDKVVRDEAKAIVLHTRFATCEKSIQNTHPFVDDEENPTVAIIHNGVINNHREFEKKFSTCDSEVLAHLYKKHDVAAGLSNLNKYTSDLTGWYTVLNLTKDNEDTPILDIYTQNGRLCSYYIPELDARVYSSAAVDIEATAKFLGMTLTLPTRAKAKQAYRVNALTGEPMDRIEFKEHDWKNVTYAEGNADDESFWERWWTENGGKLDV